MNGLGEVRNSNFFGKKQEEILLIENYFSTFAPNLKESMAIPADITKMAASSSALPSVEALQSAGISKIGKLQNMPMPKILSSRKLSAFELAVRNFAMHELSASATFNFSAFTFFIHTVLSKLRIAPCATFHFTFQKLRIAHACHTIFSKFYTFPQREQAAFYTRANHVSPQGEAPFCILQLAARR